MNFTIIPAETWKSQLRKIDISFFRSRLNTQQIVDANNHLFFFFFSSTRLILSSGWMTRRLLVWRLNGHCWENADKRQNRVIDRTQTRKLGTIQLIPFTDMGMYIYIYIYRLAVRATSKIHSPQLSQELGY